MTKNVASLRYMAFCRRKKCDKIEVGETVNGGGM